MLEHSPGANAVFCAHVGFEGAGDRKDLWNDRLVDPWIRVRFWRVPRAEIPRNRGDRIDWLFDPWARVDDDPLAPVRLDGRADWRKLAIRLRRSS